ncbi:MAG TPA: glycosyl hydrolase [Capsulimonadaceae bacterium]|nr:glycosyl hydrolase [Capsulimonadaceae bacterium]
MKAILYPILIILTAVLAVALPADASSKKGLGISTNDPHWSMELQESKVAWYYNWSQNKPDGLPTGIEFVPMAWNGVVAERLNLPKGTKAVLGFNEPDRPDQANMSIDLAVKDWPLLDKTGILLGSPAPSWWSAEWMKQFMQVAAQKNLRIDFVCIHWYNVPDPAFFLKTIQQIHDTYHKPIWITEFAVGLFGPNQPTFTPDQVAAFMKAVLPQLEKMPYVQRYAWFPSDTSDKALGASALFNKDGSPTPLGQIYASY